jgi:hypothetical protein
MSGFRVMGGSFVELSDVSVVWKTAPMTFIGAIVG